MASPDYFPDPYRPNSYDTLAVLGAGVFMLPVLLMCQAPTQYVDLTGSGATGYNAKCYAIFP